MLEYGIVTPSIHYRAHMMRIDTYQTSNMIKSAVYDAFKFVVKHIESPKIECHD